MEVEAIYRSESEQNNDIIFRLSSGYLLAKRSEDKVKKFDIDRWEEISFISGDYTEIDREPTREEIRAIKKFLRKERRGADSKSSIWDKVKAKFHSIIKG